nr:MAG TPA: hypothetical protein [Caudoviricetes sp.]
MHNLNYLDLENREYFPNILHQYQEFQELFWLLH